MLIFSKPTSFIHAVTVCVIHISYPNGYNFIPFVTKYSTYTSTHFCYSSVDMGRLSCFCVLTIVSNANEHWEHVSLELWFFLWVYDQVVLESVGIPGSVGKESTEPRRSAIQPGSGNTLEKFRLWRPETWSYGWKNPEEEALQSSRSCLENPMDSGPSRATIP